MSQPRIQASILDIQDPLDMPEVVSVAESSGYRRYWASEHYHPTQSASPVLMAALAARASTQIRVGMGGVLLRLNSPLHVAAEINVLRAFFPNRVDVGVAGARADDATARALGGAADDAEYRARMEDLIRLIGSQDAPCARFVDDKPQFWMCGTSPDSARIAGELGVRYAYHHFLGQQRGGDDDIGSVYRNAFRPSAESAPYFAIAGYGTVADNRVNALSAWQTAMTGHDVRPTFSGTGDDAAAQLVSLADRLGADEVLIDCVGPTLQARLDGLLSVANGLGLEGTAI